MKKPQTIAAFRRGRSWLVFREELSQRPASSLRGQRSLAETANYKQAHVRARRRLAGAGCQIANADCAGKIEATLAIDTPTQYLRITGDGLWWSTRVGDYIPLCHSHHQQYDAAFIQILRKEAYLWRVANATPSV